MTTPEQGGAGGSEDGRGGSAADLARLEGNLAKVEELSQRLSRAMAQRRPVNTALEAPGQDLMMKTSAAWMAEAMQNPARIVESQTAYWGKALKHYVDAQQMFVKGQFAPPADTGPSDGRFRNPLWDSHPWFNFLKQQYLFSSEALRKSVEGLDHLSPRDQQRASYFTRQMIDMMSPTNFLATNPDVLERAVATDGQSLVDGLENLVRDLEENHGDLLITLADRQAFRVGENVGTTEGAVVYRNRLFELIQYAPTTDKVHRVPLLIFPPWINKFYILDLSARKSLVKWLVDQGFTLFIVSWKNPDASYAETGIADYVEEGYLAAMREVRRITGEEKINTVGYCIAGTVLSLTLGLLEKRREKMVNSATFFTTLTDFSDQGEFTPFLDEDFVSGIEAQCSRDGYLSRYFMTRTFSFLRANDLIWQPAVKSYLMGEPPPAFDLLFWNGDGTNLPGRMAVEYLRLLCQQDVLARDGFDLNGTRVRLSDVKVPLCAIACEKDHIAAWRASFSGVSRMGSRSKRFILAESGHIAGIVMPPGRDKYGHYTSDDPVAGDPDDWRAASSFTRGSWWPEWGRWLAARSGRMIPARQPGEGAEILATAPGEYVREEVPA